MMKKMIAWMLCIVLCLQMCPVSAFAQTEETQPDVPQETLDSYETEPVETDPEETDPIETEPEETDPEETEPEETDPGETEPEETEPEETEPEETESEETEPEETEPEETEPKLTEQTAQSGGFAVSGKFSDGAQLLVAGGSSDKSDFASRFMVGVPGGVSVLRARMAPPKVLDFSGAEQVESYIYDIDLSGAYEGEVTVTLPGSDIPVLDEHEQIKVIHLLDDPAAITEDSGAYSIGEDLSEFFPGETAASGDPYTIYYEILDAERDGDGNVVFTTTSFSTFITYTVDFHFDGIDFSIPGESEILLSELFAELEIYKDAATVTDVVFSNPELVAVEQVENDWKLISLQAFDTEETLVIYFNDGSDMTIDVTDDVYDTSIHSCCTPRGANDAWTTDRNWNKVDFSVGWSIFDAVPGVDASWSVWGGGEHNCTLKLYNANGHVANSFFGHSPLRDGWLGMRGSYWYRVTDLSLGDKTATTHRVDANTLRLGYMGASEDNWFVGPTDNWLEIYMEPLDVWDDGTHANVDQVSKFAQEDEWGNRTVIIYANNREVDRKSILFPTFESMVASDINVYPYTGWLRRGDVSGAGATVVVENGVYKVYLVSQNTIKYDLDGGTGSFPNQTKTYGVQLFVHSGSPTKTGYTFDNYWVSQHDSSTWAPGANFTPDRADTLKAHYTPNTYYVKYDGNGAAGGSTAQSTHTYDAPKNLTANGFTAPTGKRFNGWNTAANGSGTSYSDKEEVTNLTTTNKGTVTLYAQWTANTYTVKYDGNGATGGSTEDSSHTYGTAKNLTANGFTKTGHKFVDWNIAANGTGTSYTDQQSVSNLTATNGGTVTLYAQWKPIYKVTLDNRSATTAGTAAYWYIHNTVLNGVYYYTDANCTAALANYTITKPTKTGYTFGGYYTEVNGGGTQYVDANGICVNNLYQREGNITLYAKWTPITYTVTYNGNPSHDGTTANSAHTYDIEKTLTPNGYQRSDYKFVGWNTNADGSGTSYTDQQSVKNLTTENGATVTLYAQWKPIYKVTLDSQGQTTGADNFYFVYTLDAYYSDSTCENALADNKIVPPTKDGYTFEGYYTQTNGEGTKYIDENGKIDNSCCKLSANTTLYADWEPIKYTITYQYNYEDAPEDNVVEYDYTTDIKLEVLTRTGYKFLGWTNLSKNQYNITNNWQYTNYNYTSEGMESPGQHQYGNVTLQARWEATEYTITYVTDYGTTPEAQTYTIEQAITLAGNPMETYSFAGWAVQEEAGNWKQDDVHADTVAAGQYGNVTLVAQWNKATVTVNHWQQNVNGADTQDETNFTKVNADTVTSQEIIGSQYTGEVKSYEGFTSPDQSTTVTVAQNGNTIDYYYTRNSYKVTTKGDDGIESTSGQGTYKYGASVTVGATVKPGYTWAGWNGDQTSTTATFSFTMPTDDVTLKAATTANTNTAYKVYHYQQNLDRTYPTTPTDTDSKTGTTGTDTAAEAKTYPGFKAQAFAQKTIEGDGSTVVKIYYERNSYTVTIHHQEKGTNTKMADDTTVDLLYGATVTVADYSKAVENYKYSSASPKTLTVEISGNEATIYYELDIADYTVSHEFYAHGVAAPTVVTETLSGTIGSSTAAAAKQITGYTAQEVQQETIAASGTVVTIRYDENKVEFNYSTDSANQIQITGKDAKPTDSETIGAVTGTPAGAIPVPAAGYKFVKWQVANDEGVMNDLVDEATVEESTNKLIPSARAVTTGNREYIPVAQDGDTPAFPNPQSYYQSTDFHAVFEAEKYTITYDLDGGALPENVTNTTEYTIQTEPFTLNAPEKSGYKFTGWAVTPTTEGDTNHNWDVTVAKDVQISGKYGNVTLTAQWEAKVTNIHVKMNVEGDYADKSLPFTGYINYTSYSNTSGDNQSPVSYQYSLKHGEMDNATKINAGNTFTLTNLMDAPNELYNAVPSVKCTYTAPDGTKTVLTDFQVNKAVEMDEGTYLIEITYSTRDDVVPTGIGTGNMAAAYTMMSVSMLLAAVYVLSRRRRYEV